MRGKHVEELEITVAAVRSPERVTFNKILVIIAVLEIIVVLDHIIASGNAHSNFIARLSAGMQFDLMRMIDKGDEKDMEKQTF